MLSKEKEKSYRMLMTLSIPLKIYFLICFIYIVAKSKKVEDKASKKIIFNLNIVSLTAVCGGILLFITCICTVSILAIQSRKYRRRKKRRPKKEIDDDKTLLPLHQNQNMRTDMIGAGHTARTIV